MIFLLRRFGTKFRRIFSHFKSRIGENRSKLFRPEQRFNRLNAEELIVQRVFQLNAFATPKLKRDFEKLKADYEKMRSERSAVLSEIDDLRARYISMEEGLETEKEEHRKALDELRDDRERYIIYLFVFFAPLSSTCVRHKNSR